MPEFLNDSQKDSLSSGVIGKCEKVIKLLPEPPLLTNLDEENEVTLEWFHFEKELTLYVTEGEFEFICSWGANILTEMIHGFFKEPEEAKPLWNWLTTPIGEDNELLKRIIQEKKY